MLPVAGSPGDLLFELVPNAKEVRKGERIVTAGTISGRLAVAVPARLLIGNVTRVNGMGELDRTIHVTPAADLRDLSVCVPG